MARTAAWWSEAPTTSSVDSPRRHQATVQLSPPRAKSWESGLKATALIEWVALPAASQTCSWHRETEVPSTANTLTTFTPWSSSIGGGFGAGAASVFSPLLSATVISASVSTAASHLPSLDQDRECAMRYLSEESTEQTSFTGSPLLAPEVSTITTPPPASPTARWSGDPPPKASDKMANGKVAATKNDAEDREYNHKVCPSPPKASRSREAATTVTARSHCS
mmetsp:Transcript_5852/g.12730  ORF Transcript_5852/g.12730 Transcript_5852/m.12730 type:complete len:223 (-) Transcript_5852:600-1268(-)